MVPEQRAKQSQSCDLVIRMVIRILLIVQEPRKFHAQFSGSITDIGICVILKSKYFLSRPHANDTRISCLKPSITSEVILRAHEQLNSRNVL